MRTIRASIRAVREPPACRATPPVRCRSAQAGPCAGAAATRPLDEPTLNVFRLTLAVFLVQAGFHGFTASLPLALARGGVADAAIGLIVGVAALVQIPAAIVGGRLVDTFGGVRLFYLGGLAYLVACGILLLPGVEPGGSDLPFVVARALQGIGIACTLPAALSLVPRMLPPDRHGFGLSLVGAGQNLTLVLLPPITIAILDAGSLDGVAMAVALFVSIGLVLALRLPLRPMVRGSTAAAASAAASAAGLSTARRRFGITFRREWAAPLAIIVCYVAHWGAVTAYLPVKASESGADIGLYFVFDGLAIFAMRLPTGWLTDRVEARTLIATGAAATAFAIGLLLLPLTTPLLIVSGLIGGAAGAIVMTPVLVELSRRSTDVDRGSAFALFSCSLATAMAIGSVGAAPLVEVSGLSAALAVGIVLILVSIVICLADPSLRAKGRGPGSDAEAAAEAIGVA